MKFEIKVDGRFYKGVFNRTGKDKFSLTLDSGTYDIELLSKQDDCVFLLVNHKPYELKLEEKNGESYLVGSRKRNYDVKILKRIIPSIQRGVKYKPERIDSYRKTIRKPQVVRKNAMTAPMAGRIVEVKIKVGDQVEYGNPVILLEAMKMMNEIGATKSGTIKEVRVKKGVGVRKGDVLVIID
jgi:biotin carboxyl carrier protein